MSVKYEVTPPSGSAAETKAAQDLARHQGVHDERLAYAVRKLWAIQREFLSCLSLIRFGSLLMNWTCGSSCYPAARAGYSIKYPRI
jgi:hypothetical protein